MDNLYYIAVTFEHNEQVIKDLNMFRNSATVRFNTKHALKSPSHITIIPPFKWNEFNFNSIDKILNNLCGGDIELVLDGFGQFNKRTIYLDVLSEKLIEFRNKLYNDLDVILHLDDRHKRFNPHITIATKDISDFDKAWNYFKNIQYKNKTIISNIKLMQYDRNNSKWFVSNFYKL